MKIKKYTKDKGNKYKVLIDDTNYILFDDVIVKYSLLLKDEISEKELKTIVEENDKLSSYYDSIKYITKKMRSKLEIIEFLRKKMVNEKVIDETIKRLEDNHFLNEELFIKAYVNDQINLTNNGKNKILKGLIKLGIDWDSASTYLDNIDNEIFIAKINKYIDKKISTNKNSSTIMLKNKIMTDLINLGYEKGDVVEVLNSKLINDDDARKREYEKIRKSLEKKYSGDVLEYKIREKLYRKGFRSNEI
mgnify:FL=1